MMESFWKHFFGALPAVAVGIYLGLFNRNKKLNSGEIRTLKALAIFCVVLLLTILIPHLLEMSDLEVPERALCVTVGGCLVALFAMK